MGIAERMHFACSASSGFTYLLIFFPLWLHMHIDELLQLLSQS